jgi:murein DD-endopeptidase MepM/ murein hydrolase activator NlpD
MLVGEARRHSSVASIITIASLATLGLAAPLVPPSYAEAAGFDCSSGPSYTVRSGDGWHAIATRVAVSTSELLDANGAQASDILVPGDELCLPGGADLAAGCDRPHTVRDGDSWYGIASSSNITTAALLDANGADEQRALHPGDVVCLPAGASGGGSSAASTAGSGSRAGAGGDAGRDGGGGGGGSGSGGGGGSYTVRSGDSWFQIAQRAEVSLRALLDANGADAQDVLLAGRELSLPAGAVRPASAPSGWVQLDALPLQGPCWYGDTWGDGREGGRRHEGVDMFAMPGAYVYAVFDGVLSSRRWAGSGAISGNAWTLTGADGSRVFYAHLADFNPELGSGSRVEAGEILGWMGGTGNATADHLHIELRPGGGGPVNPYPILRAAGGCNRGTPYTQPSGWVPE